VNFEVLTTVTSKIAVLLYVMPHRLVEIYWRFRWTSCLFILMMAGVVTFYQALWCHIQKESKFWSVWCFETMEN